MLWQYQESHIGWCSYGIEHAFWVEIDGHLGLGVLLDDFSILEMDSASSKTMLSTPQLISYWVTVISISAVRMAAILEIC